MNHIFYLHSNTCVISSFDIISDLVRRKENVIIVTERNVKYPFFEGKVALFDMQKVIDKYRIKSSSIIGQVINYRLSLHPNCNAFALKIINDADFLLYTPSYNMYTIKPFVKNKHCKGYYYIEEGFMSYLSEKTLKGNFRNRRYKRGRILMDLVGAGESFDYKITEKFKGCIGLSNYSFPWCEDKNKITGFDRYFSNIPYEDVNIDYLITTDLLKDDVEIIKAAFKTAIERMLQENTNAKFAIKFHPSAFVYEKEKAETIIDYVQSAYKNNEITILPAPYSIEALMYHRSVSIFCIFGVSSLQLYALMLNSTPYMLVKENGNVVIKKIESVPEFIDISSVEWKS